jgi:PadR family transcriptional regulator, regulatory protein AphA
MARRSSSSMVVLALLGIDRWTPYELVQHLKRSMIHHIWPRAESKVYEEPKRLVAAGHAKASVDRGNPRRTRYTISARGRRVLARWVAEPGTGVRFESEGALKVLFAENGTKEQLLATIDAMRAEALADVARVKGTLEFVLTDGPPYPGRIHQSVLVMDLVLRITTAVAEWADATERRVAGWPDLTPDDAMRAAAIDQVRHLHERAWAAARRPSAEQVVDGDAGGQGE